MKHEAGLQKLHIKVKPEWFSTEGIKANKIGQIIEQDSCAFVSNLKLSDLDNETERFYHGVTRDWITNEIFRRVEPKNRTMGEYLNEELQFLNIHCGRFDENHVNRFDY